MPSCNPAAIPAFTHEFNLKAFSILTLLTILAILYTGCGGKQDSSESDDRQIVGDDSIPMEEKIGLLLKDGPLTAEARAQIALLVDGDAENDGEVYQRLKRIGRDAVPALVEVIYATHEEKIKQNSMWILGELGLAADGALPFLEDTKIKGPTWLSYSASQAIHRIEEAKSCGLPDLPEDIEVHVIGRYRGEKELDIQLGSSGHMVTEIEVVVNETDDPVVLVLTAYDPVVWKVGTTPGADLAAVLVSGYHSQALLGIPHDLPHRVISGEQSLGCKPFSASGAADAASIEWDIFRLTGHKIDRFYSESPETGFRIGGDPYFRSSNVSFSSDLSLDDYDVYEGEIPAGPRGVDELQRQGKIRLATQKEIDEWMNGAREQNPEMYARLYLGTTYVVMERIELPPGLFGGNSRTFIIPAGIPKPDGPKGHCQFYYMKDFTRE
jgi:hypothetical protein